MHWAAIKKPSPSFVPDRLLAGSFRRAEASTSPMAAADILARVLTLLLVVLAIGGGAGARSPSQRPPCRALGIRAAVARLG
jgi:hypothetical protein